MLRALGRTVRTGFAVGAFAIVAPAAEAGYTAAHPPVGRTDMSHERILEQVYGGDFVKDAGGVSFSNESGVTVTRMDDGQVVPGKAGPGGVSISAQAVAAFSGKSKTAGYFGQRSGGQVEKLIDVAGRHFDVSGTQGEIVADGGFLVGRGPGAKTYSSIGESNGDGMDHIIGAKGDGSPRSGQPASLYLRCLESHLAPRNDRGDSRLVFEMEAAEVTSRAALAQPLLIPLPPAAWTGLGGFLGVAGVLYRARRRHPPRVG